MDTVRTIYCDSENATVKADKSFVLDIPGGISVAEGARTYIDAVSFTNVFSEKVTDKNDEVFVKTLTNKSLLETRTPQFPVVLHLRERRDMNTPRFCFAKNRKKYPIGNFSE